MNERPIGVFDSGLGGLTAVRELEAMLPNEDIVYFGDTGRVPYGSRGRDIIISYARQDIAFLLSKDVKAILAACGTVSSTFPKEDGDALPVPYLGVVQPTAAAAVAATKNGRVGIIGTETTIASGSYQEALRTLAPEVQSVAAACPLFVPLVENGHFAPGDAMAALAAEEYLAPIRAAGVDTLILGCTHYPLLAPAIDAYFDGEVTLVDSGRQAARALRERLAAEDLLARGSRREPTRFYVSDEPSRFDRLARLFLGADAERPAKRVYIDNFGLLEED